MANTGYIINPQVIQVFTSGPNSGSEVSSSYNINFDISSSFTSSNLCGNEYSYKLFNPLFCEIDNYCVYPTLVSSTPVYCDKNYNYTYSIQYLVNSSSISDSIMEYSLDPTFTNNVGFLLLLNQPDPNTIIVNISDGLSTLPLNGNTQVYFRMKNICGGSISSSYSNVISSSCLL